MKLILSTDALPEQSIDALVHACQRRALGGLEVVLDRDQGHGMYKRKLSRGYCAPLRRALRADVTLDWFHAGGQEDTAAAWCRQAQRLGAGLLMADTKVQSPGGRIAQIHTCEDSSVHAAVDWAKRHDMYTAWEIEIRETGPGTIDRVFEQTGDRLAHIRLLGGGPEAEELEGGAMSHLFRTLALAGYQGTIALAPSSPDRLMEWRDWLLDRRGWGCNTAANKRARIDERSNV